MKVRKLSAANARELSKWIDEYPLDSLINLLKSSYITKYGTFNDDNKITAVLFVSEITKQKYIVKFYKQFPHDEEDLLNTTLMENMLLSAAFENIKPGAILEFPTSEKDLPLHLRLKDAGFFARFEKDGIKVGEDAYVFEKTK